MRPFFVVLSLAMAACTNPDDILAARGTVVSNDPVEGQVVHLRRGFFDQARVVFYPGQWCATAAPLKEGFADREGRYGFEVFRVETRRAACFRIDTTFPSGSVAWVDFSFYGPDNVLPPMLDWRAQLRLDGGVLQFEPPVPWPSDAPPVREGETPKVGVELTHLARLETADGGLAWEAEDRYQLPASDSDIPGYPPYGREALVVDDLRVEDFEGTLSLSASLVDPAEERPLISLSPGPVRMTAGERLSLRGTRVPLSRGLACPEVATPCPLTDGELTEVDAGMREEVSFSLPTPSVVSAAVLRGAVMASDRVSFVLADEDGGLVGEFEGLLRQGHPQAFGVQMAESILTRDAGYVRLRHAYLVVPLDAGTPASRVTVRFGGGLARIREFSLFGP